MDPTTPPAELGEQARGYLEQRAVYKQRKQGTAAEDDAEAS